MRRTWPVPVAHLSLVGAGVLVLVVLGTLPLTRWPYRDWVAVSATTRECLVFVAPWGAAWCAWVAGRYLGSRSMLCPPSAARSGAEIVRAQLGYLLGAVLIGYLLGLVPVLVVTLLGATQGGLDWAVLIGAVMVLVTFCSLGYLIGCLAGRLSSVILAVAASLGLVLMVDTWGPVVAPLRLGLTSAGWYESPVVSVFRILFFGALALALIVAAGSVVDRRAMRHSLAGYMGLAVLLVPLLVGAVARGAAPAVAVPEQNPPSHCADIQSGNVCVHAAKAVLLPSLVDTVNRVLTVVDGRPAVPVSLVLDADIARDPRTGTFVLNLEPDEETWTDWAATDVAQFISGLAACRMAGSSDGTASANARDQYGIANGIAIWITRSAGFNTALLDHSETSDRVARMLEQMAPSVARGLYRRLGADIASCDLSPGSLS